MRSRLKRIVRQAVSAMFFYCGLLSLWKYFFQRHPIVLYFHEVYAERDYTGWCQEPLLLMPEKLFRQTLDHLKRHYQLMPVNDVLQCRSRRAVALTFDDGYRGVYRRAFPLLKEAGARATVFVVSGRIGTASLLWWDVLGAQIKRLISLPAQERARAVSQFPEKWRALLSSADPSAVICEYKQASSAQRASLDMKLSETVGSPTAARERIFLSEGEIREMLAAGIEFGAHTATHPLLTWSGPAGLAFEIEDSKQALERITASTVRWFAYPDGCFNELVEEAVRKAGFDGAVQTFRSERNGPFAIPRIGLNPETITGLNGEFSPARLEATMAQFNRRTLMRVLKSGFNRICQSAIPSSFWEQEERPEKVASDATMG